MTYFPVQSPYNLFTATDGEPLESGHIYIGAANQNPITNPITITWDTAGLYPAAQPVRTIGGYPDRNGSPGIIYVNAGAFEDYSILVQDKHGNQIYLEQSAISAIGGYGGNSLDIINDLRSISGYDQPIYVRGHTAVGDGGQSYFEWTDGAAPGTYVDDDGITIVPTGGDGSGAWVRQYSGAIDVRWYGAENDNDAIIDAVATQLSPVFIPEGTWTLTATLKIYPNQKVFGAGVDKTFIESSITGAIGYENYTPVVATADTSGVIALDSKDLDNSSIIEDFSIKNTGAYSIGLLYCGKLEGGIRNIECVGDDAVAAGSRTSLGVVITGLNKLTNRGCYYSFIENLTVNEQKIGLYYGCRCHSHGPIIRPFIYNCDIGIYQDDGTEFSFNALYLAAPSTMTLVQPDIEVIDGNAIDNLVGTRVSVYSGYFDSIGGDLFTLNGSSLIYSQPYIVGLTGDVVALNTGNVHALGFESHDIATFPNRTRHTAMALELPGYWGDSGAIVNASNPSLLTGSVTVSGTGTAYASATVTFSNYTGITATVYNAAIFLQITGTTAGGSNNTEYQAAYSGLSNPDTAFTVQIKRIDGTNFSENVFVRWFAIGYTA